MKKIEAGFAILAMLGAVMVSSNYVRMGRLVDILNSWNLLGV